MYWDCPKVVTVLFKSGQKHNDRSSELKLVADSEQSRFQRLHSNENCVETFPIKFFAKKPCNVSKKDWLCCVVKNTLSYYQQWPVKVN